MIVTDPTIVKSLLEGNARLEAIQIIREARRLHGSQPMWGMARYAASPTIKQWILVSQFEAARDTEQLMREGLSSKQLIDLLGITDEEMYPEDKPKRLGWVRQSFDEAGPGRKQCPSCKKFTASRAYQCICGHRFVKKAPEIQFCSLL